MAEMPPIPVKRVAPSSSRPTPMVLRGMRMVSVAQAKLAVRRRVPAGRGAFIMRVVPMRKITPKGMLMGRMRG